MKKKEKSRYFYVDAFVILFYVTIIKCQQQFNNVTPFTKSQRKEWNFFIINRFFFGKIKIYLFAYICAAVWYYYKLYKYKNSFIKIKTK